MSKLSNYEFSSFWGFKSTILYSKYTFQAVEFQNLPFLSWLECGIFCEISDFRTFKKAIFRYKEKTRHSVEIS